MKIEASEKREVTYTLTLTEQEASDLKLLAGYDSSVPQAVRRLGKDSHGDARRIADFMPVLYLTLDSAGVIAQPE